MVFFGCLVWLPLPEKLGCHYLGLDGLAGAIPSCVHQILLPNPAKGFWWFSEKFSPWTLEISWLLKSSHDKSSQEAYGQLIPRSEHNLLTPTIAGQQKRWKASLVEVGILKMILSDFVFTNCRKIKGPQKMDDANRSIDKFYMTNICWKHVVINTWWTLHMSITISCSGIR